MRAFFAIIALLYVAAGAGAAELADQARAILKDHCYQCHNGPGSVPNYDFDVLDRESLVEAGVLEPGDPEASQMYDAVESKRMPKLEERQRNPVTPEELATLKEWIEEDAVSPAKAEVKKQFIKVEMLLTAVRNFLREKDASDRSFYRFFTLHQLHNKPNVKAEDLDQYRAALSKALNSLNWSPSIVLPEVIDAADNSLSGTVLAIDTRNLIGYGGRSWADLKLWNRIAQSYPYALSYSDPADPRSHLLEEVTELLQDENAAFVTTKLPILRADWFLATATRPPLYHELLGLPENARDLEHELNVNIPAALAFASPTPEMIARAGFPKSGVSGQNRLLQRTPAKYGFYWKSYDFRATTPRASLVRFPFGPQDMLAAQDYKHRTAFNHDGGEIIFSLPNGLQAYMLVNGKDQRIDAGPIDVVSDQLKISGTPEIVNGLSCMACHNEGMINFKDSIRDGHAVSGRLAQDVARLYPDAKAMQRLVDRDRAKFVAALRQAIGPFLLGKGDTELARSELADPVSKAAGEYRLVYLDREAIASELDFENADELEKAVGAERIRSLGLEPVFRQDARISRNEWELTAGKSLMQELAEAAGYTPILPIR